MGIREFDFWVITNMLLGHYEYAFGSLWHFCTSYWVDISFQFP